MIFGIGYGFRFNCLFGFLKSLRKRTQFYLGLGFAKHAAPHSEPFSTLRNPNRTKHSTSLLNISSCTLGTDYSRKHISFASYFNLKSTRSVFQVPSIPLNNYSDFCNVFGISLCCDILKCWHWGSIILCKFDFSYLASNITCNGSVVVCTCSDPYNFSL